MMEPLTLDLPGKVLNARRYDLLQTMMAAAVRAWDLGIRLNIKKVRQADLNPAFSKQGADFFTEADTASEQIIIESLHAGYSPNAFRIFAEEAGAYSGNPDAEITIRIDPIDGTESFKFGKPNWSIMIGAYLGRDALECQIASVVYWPEYYDEMLFFLEGAGTFKGNLTTRQVSEFSRVDDQNDLNNIIVAVYKHSNINKRGKIDDIIRALEFKGARVKSTTPAEVKEALETRGRRAMIIDGDFNEVDFISYSSLVRLGYQIRDWAGTLYNIDDPALANKKFSIVPPGRAGEVIFDIVREYA
jgi:fructose-1,6-bisphosphatase/inositol monophosphatase family enzyme